jgi:hypothetical protein
MIYRIRVEHANHYTTDAVNNNMLNFCLINLFFAINNNILLVYIQYMLFLLVLLSAVSH